jgi:hypothetical protein
MDEHPVTVDQLQRAARLVAAASQRINRVPATDAGMAERQARIRRWERQAARYAMRAATDDVLADVGTPGAMAELRKRDRMVV